MKNRRFNNHLHFGVFALWDCTLENKLLSVNITKKEASSLNNLEELVIKLIKGKNNITSEEISSIASKSPRTIKTVLMELQNKKIIKRMNGKRYGHWKVK